MNLLETAPWSAPLWFIGTVIGLGLILILIALITGREVTFWPPKIGEKKVELSNDKTETELKKDYGIRVLTPDANSEHYGNVTVTGSFKNQPPANSIIAIVLNEGNHEYWPKSEIVFDNLNSSWKTTININPNPSGKRKILICSIGKYAKELIEFQKRTGEKNVWLGIKHGVTMSENIQIHAQVTIMAHHIPPASTSTP